MMGDERERFEALRQVYESRIDSLTSSVRKVYLSLKSDEVGLAIRESPGLEGHYRDHLEEIVESELAQEREEFVRRLAGSVSQFQARIVELERHSGATAHQLSRSEAALASLQQQSAAREAASAAALREAATKCQQASSDNAGLKSELAVALDELDSASASFHQSRERGMAFEGQLASMNEKCQAMLEQLVSTETTNSKLQQALIEETNKAAGWSLEAGVLKERCGASEERAVTFKQQLKRATRQLAEMETEYGYTDADLRLVCERYGSLNAHMEQVLAQEASNNEEALEQMQRRVGALKDKLAERLNAQRLSATAVAAELAHAQATASAQAERAAALESQLGATTAAKQAAEDRAASAEETVASLQNDARELERRVALAGAELVRERASAELRLGHEAAAASELDDVATALRQKLREGDARRADLEEALAAERANLTAVEAAAQKREVALQRCEAKGKLSEAKATESEAAYAVMATHLTQASAAIAKLKTMVRDERTARLAAAGEAEAASRINSEATELERRAAREEAEAGKAREAALERKVQERTAQVTAVGGELKALLKQLESERKEAAELRQKEQALSTQVGAFTAQFAVLEQHLGKLTAEKKEFVQAADVMAASHEEETAAAAEEAVRLRTRLAAEKAARADVELRLAAAERSVAEAQASHESALECEVSALREASEEAEVAHALELSRSRESSSALERQVARLAEESEELRQRSRLTEELERSQSELALLAEVQRLEAHEAQRSVGVLVAEARAEARAEAEAQAHARFEAALDLRLAELRASHEASLAEAVARVEAECDRRVSEAKAAHTAGSASAGEKEDASASLAAEDNEAAKGRESN